MVYVFHNDAITDTEYRPTVQEKYMYRVTQKKGNFQKPNKNWRYQRKKFIDRNWTITTCLLRDSNRNYQCLKITSSSTYAFFHCHYAFKNFPFFCVTLCVLHALQNATLCLKWQVLLVQFLSINFFLGFLQFCWVFEKFRSFCVTPYLNLNKDI